MMMMTIIIIIIIIIIIMIIIIIIIITLTTKFGLNLDEESYTIRFPGYPFYKGRPFALSRGLRLERLQFAVALVLNLYSVYGFEH